MTSMNPPKYSKEDVQACIDMLEELARNGEGLAHFTKEQKIALMSAAGRVSRPDKIEIEKRRRSVRLLLSRKIEEHQRKVRAATGIRSARKALVFTAPKQIANGNGHGTLEVRKLIKPRACYVCKAEFTRVHFFYDSMCPACADFNYSKRFQTASLKGQVALITGSRLKIGYQAALMMLRAGARVIATTRFPVDSALRYSREEDFAQWKDRLDVYGMDLRHTPSVELFCDFIARKYDRLDILVNNAAQTVRRPPGFYAHLMKNEALESGGLPENVRPLLSSFQECRVSAGIGVSASAKLSQIPYKHDRVMSLEMDAVFPDGKLDADLQQVDLRETNSWRLRLGDIPTAEMIELQLVNAIAPFVLCNKLSNMMKREDTGQKHIVNVSAMEGKFTRYVKTDRHPHTNMAKAALNMLVHTSAKDLAADGIYMNAVDTGWVTDEDPAALSARKQEDHDFQPPLDIVDGAARVCDPFFNGILTGTHVYGKFLKDYFPVDW